MAERPNAVDNLLIRLNMSEAINKMREMKIDRLVGLRKISPEQLAEAIPDSQKRQLLMEAINSRGSLQFRRPNAAEQTQSPPNTDGEFGRNNNNSNDNSSNNNNNNMRFTEGGGAADAGGRHEWREGGRGGGFGRGGRGRGMGGYRNQNNYNNMNAGGEPGVAGQVGSRRMNNNNNNNNNARWQQNDMPKGCRHYFSEKGCNYGDKCRYSHDEALRSQMTEQAEQRSNHHKPQGDQNMPTHNNDANTTANENEKVKEEEKHPSVFDTVKLEDYPFNVTCEVPFDHMKFLLGSKNNKLGKIHEVCNTTNIAIHKPEEDVATVSVTLLGNTKESVERAKQMVLDVVGAKSEKVRRNRFEYAVNEYTANVQAVKYMAACNTKNKGTERYLSESIMRNLVSTFRFAQPQEIHHFCILSNPSEKEKMDRISKVITQLKGVQAVIFCGPKHVVEMSKVANRISRFFNNVTPCFVHRQLSKEARMNVLDKFKAGVPNEEGVKQRLLVTSDDYAKLARKTIIPYVNLIVHFTVPTNQEMYVLQSHVAGRQGTIGASLLCVSSLSEMPVFNSLQQGFSFVNLTDEEGFRDTAMQLSYDTVDKPLTLPEAEPRPDWRDHINDAKPKDAIIRINKNTTNDHQ